MVVYYIKKEGERLADYRYPIKEGDICMLYDGEVIKTVYIDSELDPNSIWRDFKFIDTKSLKSYQFPTSDSILCAPVGDKHAIGDTGLLTQLIKECKGEWLLDFLNETSAVLSGFVDYWDIGILSRFIGDNNLDVIYENEETLTEFLENPEENEEVDNYDEDEDVDDVDFLPKSYDVRWFCLSALACLEGQMDNRSYEILYDTLNGTSRSELSSRFHLTQERIRQIVVKATKQAKELLIEQRKNIEGTKTENAQLNAQLKLLREEMVRLKSSLPKESVTHRENKNEALSTELVLLLETSIDDIRFPARASNILKYMGIKQFADIPQIESSIRLLEERNSGKKTVHDVKQMLEDFCLTFGMSYKDIIITLNANDWHIAKKKWINERDNVVKQESDVVPLIGNPISNNGKIEGSSQIKSIINNQIYKEFTFSQQDKRRKEAILEAMTNFLSPVTPNVIASTIDPTIWGINDVVSVDIVESILKRLPEVEYVKWGKYILKSK